MRRPRHFPRRLLPCPYCGERHRCLPSWPVPPPVPIECLCGVQVLRDWRGGLWDEDEGALHHCPPRPWPVIVPIGMRSELTAGPYKLRNLIRGAA